MVNNVIGVVNYVIAARPSLLNFVIADTDGSREDPGRNGCRQAQIALIGGQTGSKPMAARPDSGH